MTFVQIIDCRTGRVDEFNRLMDNWVEQTQGRRTATHAVVGADRADSRHLVEIVEFPSYEEAMHNSALPETDRIFREIVALCDEPPSFTDLDVFRDEQLNKAAATRCFEVLGQGDLSAIEELFASDYRDHDPADKTEVRGASGMRNKAEMYRRGFDARFTVESQLAEGDQVATRWSWRGRHIGEIMGLPATDKVVEMTGTTIFRFRDGRIQEGWWNWDNLGMMRQLGFVRV